MNKTTIGDTNSKIQMINYLRIIEGQIRGLQTILQGEIYCIDIITQTTSIKQELSRIEDILMEYHLTTCSIREIRNGNEGKAVDEIIRVYQLKRK